MQSINILLGNVVSVGHRRATIRRGQRLSVGTGIIATHPLPQMNVGIRVGKDDSSMFARSQGRDREQLMGVVHGVANEIV